MTTGAVRSAFTTTFSAPFRARETFLWADAAYAVSVARMAVSATTSATIVRNVLTASFDPAVRTLTPALYQATGSRLVNAAYKREMPVMAVTYAQTHAVYCLPSKWRRAVQ